MAKRINIKPNRKECKGPGYYRDYEAKRRESGKDARVKLKEVRRMVRMFVKNPAYRDLEADLVVALLKWYNLSYRGMVNEINCNKSLCKKLGFKRTPPKSTMWWNVYQITLRLLVELIAFTTGMAARATLVADLCSYTYDRYEQDSNDQWARRIIKHHVLLTMDGCVAASAVTDGDRDDCSMLSRAVPTGSGCLPVDRKHYGKVNCGGGAPHRQLPCMRPQSHAGHGSGARANMVSGGGASRAAFTKSTACATSWRAASRHSKAGSTAICAR